jgi:hypothetical protein
MISVVEALNYRAIRHTRQSLERFQVLVGPNASGKSTFLGIIDLVGLLADWRDDIAEPLAGMSADLRDWTFMRRGARFEIVVEAPIPSRLRRSNGNGDRIGHDFVRYEISIGENEADRSLSVLAENLWLRSSADSPHRPPEQRSLFPEEPKPPESLLLREGTRSPKGWKRIVQKTNTNDYFRAETSEWNAPFNFGHTRLALANLPEDEARFPVAIWFRRLLTKGIQRLELSSEALRRPARPGSTTEFLPDGSNLPWVIERFRAGNPDGFARWLAHVQTALPDLTGLDTIERVEDRHRYLRLSYRTGLQAPSWTVSDGTLRLLALTLIPYLDIPDRIFLIEEPENGIHPQAVETVVQALADARDCQILCATHSPVLLSLAEPSQILCFARTQDGATDIVRGDKHPRLSQWRRDVNLGTVFAAGLLG